MKRLFLILIPAILLSACISSEKYGTANDFVEEALKNITLITVEDLYNIMDTGEEIYTLIDVRQEVEYYYGYIPGSVVLPRGSLEFNINNPEFWDEAGLYLPEKDETIILYCKKGSRGILAGKTLEMMGYKNVLVLKGGFKNWELSYPDYTEKNLEMLGGESDTHDMGGGC